MVENKNYTLWLAGICVVVFIIQSIIPGFTDSFMLSSSAITQPWQFITAIFLHGGIAHLFYNLFALIIFGLILEKLIGSRKFILLFLVSGIIANLISFAFYHSSLGASGAIMGIIGVLAVLRPMMTVWMYNLPMPMFVVAIIWTAGSVLGIFGLGDPSVGHIAHLSGIVVGLAYGFYLRAKYDKRNKINNSNMFERKIIIDENSMRQWEDRNFK